MPVEGPAIVGDDPGRVEVEETPLAVGCRQAFGEVDRAGVAGVPRIAIADHRTAVEHRALRAVAPQQELVGAALARVGHDVGQAKPVAEQGLPWHREAKLDRVAGRHQADMALAGRRRLDRLQGPSRRTQLVPARGGLGRGCGKAQQQQQTGQCEGIHDRYSFSLTGVPRDAKAVRRPGDPG